MEIFPRPTEKKYYLMLCEIHYPVIHGKTDDSDPNIETHYLVYDRYDPTSGVSIYHLDEYEDYDTDNEYDSDEDIDEIGLCKLNNDMNFLKKMYSIQSNFANHPTIRNYHNIISNPNYIKPEIGEYIILPTQETIAILKTFWIRIIQKKWKKVFQERKNIIRQRGYSSNLLFRELKSKWPISCINLPGLRGILSDLKK
jgi:hypothetical protein